MARKGAAPKRVKGLPLGGSNYNSGSKKAASSMQKQYGSNWQHVFYGLANKRAGRGTKGKNRMHGVASTAYAKGSHWGGKGKTNRARRSRTRLKG